VRMRESLTGPPGVRSGRRGDAAVAARGAATARVAAAEGAIGEEAATTTRVVAASIGMATRMVDTRVIRETDIRAGGRTAAVTAGDKPRRLRPLGKPLLKAANGS
jgi:hypothetical protein